MEMAHRKEVYELANNLQLKYSHFVRGSFVCRGEERVKFNDNRLMFVLENPDGAANYLEDEYDCFVLKPGWCYLVPAFHPAVHTLNENFKFISIHFRLEFFSGSDIVSVLRRNVAMESPVNTALLERCFNPDDGRLFQSILLNHVVYQVVERSLGKDIPMLVEAELKFSSWRGVVEYINRHCVATTGVEDLASSAGMSRGAFTRKFSQETGISPKKFFNRQLAHRAAELLLQSRLTVREIAGQLRFSSEYAFSRFFKSQLGTAPRNYRNRIRL